MRLGASNIEFCCSMRPAVDLSAIGIALGMVGHQPTTVAMR